MTILKRVVLTTLFCLAASASYAIVIFDRSQYASPGSSMWYSFTIVDSTLKSGQITIHLPDAVTYAGFSTSDGVCTFTLPSGSGGDVVCTTNTLQRLLCTVRVDVSPSVPVGTVLNATMTFDADGKLIATKTLPTTVAAPTDLSITATASTPAKAGRTYPVTVRLTNNGSSPAYGPAFTLSRPSPDSGLQINAPATTTWYCAHNPYPPTLYCRNAAVLQPGESEELAVDVESDPAASSDVLRAVDFMWNSDTNASNDDLTVVTPLSTIAAASLQGALNSTAPPAPLRTGFDYTLRWSVFTDGPSLRDFTFIYDTPANTVFEGLSQTGAACTTPAPGSPGRVTCAAASLKVWYVDVSVRTNAAGAVTHTATANGSNSANPVTSPVAVTLNDVVTTVTSRVFQSGNDYDAPAMLEITVQKPAADAWREDGMTVDFTLPPGAVLKGPTFNTDVQCTGTHCSLPSLPPYDGFEQQYWFNIDLPPHAGTFPLTYVLNGHGVAPLTVTTQLIVNALPMAATLTASKARVVVGEDVDFTLSVSAISTQAIDATVGVTMPPGLTLHDVAAAQGSCQPASPSELHCTIVNLAPQATAVIGFSGRAVLPGDAEVHAAANTYNHSIPLTAKTTIVVPVALLSTALTGDRAVVRTDDRLVYTLTVHNAGPDAANTVAAEVTTHGEAALVSADANGFASCGAGKSLVRCDTPLLAAGGTATATITLVAPTAPGEVSATATVTSPITAPQTANVSTPVVGRGLADLAVRASGVPNAVAPGQLFSLHYTITNIGSADAAAVVFDTTLSTGLTVQSLTSTRGSCTAAHCTIGTLAYGTSADIAVTATATRAGSEWVRGAASTTSQQPSQDNDAKQVSVNVVIPRTRIVRH